MPYTFVKKKKHNLNLLILLNIFESIFVKKKKKNIKNKYTQKKNK